jgi:hypothetical protein
MEERKNFRKFFTFRRSLRRNPSRREPIMPSTLSAYNTRDSPFLDLDSPFTAWCALALIRGNQLSKRRRNLREKKRSDSIEIRFPIDLNLKNLITSTSKPPQKQGSAQAPPPLPSHRPALPRRPRGMHVPRLHVSARGVGLAGRHAAVKKAEGAYRRGVEARRRRPLVAGLFDQGPRQGAPAEGAEGHGGSSHSDL